MKIYFFKYFCRYSKSLGLSKSIDSTDGILWNIGLKPILHFLLINELLFIPYNPVVS